MGEAYDKYQVFDLGEQTFLDLTSRVCVPAGCSFAAGLHRVNCDAVTAIGHIEIAMQVIDGLIQARSKWNWKHCSRFGS